MQFLFEVKWAADKMTCHANSPEEAKQVALKYIAAKQETLLKAQAVSDAESTTQRSV